MKIGELSRRCGLSIDTIRYYERIGLLPRADRGQSRQRDYDSSILAWIEFLGRLKATGMPLREMISYTMLREQGAATNDDRRLLLEQHRARVARNIAEMQENLVVLDTKIASYGGSNRTSSDDEFPQPELLPIR